MKKLFLIFITTCLFFSGNTIAQQSPQEKGLEVITLDAIQAQLEFLASDWTEGREAGTRGMYMASDYIASMFKYSGVPGGGDPMRYRGRRMTRGGAPSQVERSYFQNFTLLETLDGGESEFKVHNGSEKYIFQEGIDYTIRASSSADISGNVVFVGYGIQSDEFGIDELGGADLNGKIVLRLSGLPGMGNEDSELYKKIMSDRRAAYTLMRSRDRILREKGVVAVIDVNPGYDMASSGEYIDDMNMSPNESSRNSEFRRLRQADNELSSGLVTISAGDKISRAIVKNSRIDIEEYMEKAQKGLKKAKPLDIPGCTVNITADVKKRRVRVRNVVAMIEGKKKDEFVVIGAHMDHMGISGGRIWNGADDNASGTVGVMTIARAFAATGVQPERTVLFCGWTGEEKGLLGSEYFSQNPVVSSMENCKFYINFDMIARDSEEDEDGVKVGVTYNSKYPESLEMCERNVADYDLSMDYNFRGQEDPTGGSDYTAFTQNGVPILAFMAAMHPDYHTPNDEVQFVNWEKMLDIIKLGFLNLWEEANK